MRYNSCFIKYGLNFRDTVVAGCWNFARGKHFTWHGKILAYVDIPTFDAIFSFAFAEKH